jgi:hypothetical protein
MQISKLNIDEIEMVSGGVGTRPGLPGSGTPSFNPTPAPTPNTSPTAAPIDDPACSTGFVMEDFGECETSALPSFPNF